MLHDLFVLFLFYQDDDEECLHSDEEEEDKVFKPVAARTPVGIYACVGDAMDDEVNRIGKGHTTLNGC